MERGIAWPDMATAAPKLFQCPSIYALVLLFSDLKPLLPPLEFHRISSSLPSDGIQ